MVRLAAGVRQAEDRVLAGGLGVRGGTGWQVALVGSMVLGPGRGRRDDGGGRRAGRGPALASEWMRMAEDWLGGLGVVGLWFDAGFFGSLTANGWASGPEG